MNRTCGVKTFQPFRPCTAEDIEKDSLRPIVARMSQCDPLRSSLVGNRAQKAVTGAPGGSVQF